MFNNHGQREIILGQLINENVGLQTHNQTFIENGRAHFFKMFSLPTPQKNHILNRYKNTPPRY